MRNRARVVTPALVLVCALFLSGCSLLAGLPGIGGGPKWPDNEFTRAVPKPSMELQLAMQMSDTTFMAAFKDPSLDEVRAYGEELLAEGFNIDQGVREVTQTGSDEVTMYVFTGIRSSGFEVTLIWDSSVKMTSLEISKT